MRRIATALLVGLLTLAACGSDDEKLAATQTGGAGGSGAAGGGGAGGAAGTGAAGTGTAGTGTGTGGLDASVAGAAGSSSAGYGGAQNDASVEAPVLADAGWFDCDGCACNGATHYCWFMAGGFLPAAPPPPDAAVCGDAGYFGCTPLPSDCVDPPSCSCIPMPPNEGCWCYDDGGGLRVNCVLP